MSRNIILIPSTPHHLKIKKLFLVPGLYKIRQIVAHWPQSADLLSNQFIFVVTHAFIHLRNKYSFAGYSMHVNAVVRGTDILLRPSLASPLAWSCWVQRLSVPSLPPEHSAFPRPFWDEVMNDRTKEWTICYYLC